MAVQAENLTQDLGNIIQGKSSVLHYVLRVSEFAYCNTRNWSVWNYFLLVYFLFVDYSVYLLKQAKFAFEFQLKNVQ